MVSATFVGANFTNNAAILDSGSLHAEGTQLLSLSAIDFINSTVTEGESASAALRSACKCLSDVRRTDMQTCIYCL